VIVQRLTEAFHASTDEFDRETTNDEAGVETSDEDTDVDVDELTEVTGNTDGFDAGGTRSRQSSNQTNTTS
jgi:hypothetical protein